MSRFCINRPSINRLTLVIRHLQRGCNLTQVAAAIEVHPETIRRDISLLRDGLGYQIDWNYATERWEVQPPKERVL